jgi:RhoGEF domain
MSTEAEEAQQRQSLLEAAIEEVKTSEKRYHEKLGWLSDFFSEPPWIDMTIRGMNCYQKINAFRDLSASILVAIDAITNAKDSPEKKALNIASFLAEKSNAFFILQTFVENFNDALNEITALSLEQTQKNNMDQLLKKTTGITLQALFIEPVQRFPRYDLLVEKLSTHLEDRATKQEIGEKATHIKKSSLEAQQPSKFSEEKDVLWLAIHSEVMDLKQADIKRIETLLTRLESLQSETDPGIQATENAIKQKATLLIEIAKSHETPAFFPNILRAFRRTMSQIIETQEDDPIPERIIALGKAIDKKNAPKQPPMHSSVVVVPGLALPSTSATPLTFRQPPSAPRATEDTTPRSPPRSAKKPGSNA